MKTKEELLKRIQKIDVYNVIRGYEWVGHKNVVTSPDVLLLNNFEESDSMCNFTLDFLELLKKYGVKMHGVNGMLDTFEFSDAPEKYLGIAPFFRWLQLSDEEMNDKIEQAKLITSEAQKENTDKEGNDDYDEYEEDEECEMCEYDACGSFVADIEVNVGKIEPTVVDEDLVNTCYNKVWDILEVDDVAIDSDEDELFERIKIKELENGTTLVTIDEVKCSVRVDIQASCLDEANDDRWNEFYCKVRALDYLKNIRNEYVSEAD